MEYLQLFVFLSSYDRFVTDKVWKDAINYIFFIMSEMNVEVIDFILILHTVILFT